MFLEHDLYGFIFDVCIDFKYIKTFVWYLSNDEFLKGLGNFVAILQFLHIFNEIIVSSNQNVTIDFRSIVSVTIWHAKYISKFNDNQLSQ